MVLGTAFGWPNLATVIASIVLAFVSGYGLTMRGGLTAGLVARGKGHGTAHHLHGHRVT